MVDGHESAKDDAHLSEEDSWGDIARQAGTAAATTFGSWIASLLVWGGVALIGAWIFSGSNTSVGGDPTRSGWLGLAIFVVGVGGFVGFQSLRTVLALIQGRVRFIDVSPMRFLRAIATLAAWAFALYAVFRAVAG